MKKICERCGKTFTASTPRKFCTSCVPASKDILLRECPICGKSFETDTELMIYCSVECRKIAKDVRNKHRKVEYSRQEQELTKYTVFNSAYTYYYMKDGVKIIVPQRLINIFAVNKDFTLMDFDEGYCLELICRYVPGMGDTLKNSLCQLLNDFDIEFV